MKGNGSLEGLLFVTSYIVYCFCYRVCNCSSYLDLVASSCAAEVLAIFGQHISGTDEKMARAYLKMHPTIFFSFAITSLNLRRNLDGNQFSGAINPSMEKLINLKEIYINNNNLTRQIPVGLKNQPGLDRRGEQIWMRLARRKQIWMRLARRKYPDANFQSDAAPMHTEDSSMMKRKERLQKW